MGQYFVAVNETKREYVCPWEIGYVAKFWEWCCNYSSSIFPYLLRKSDESGGGDINPDEVTYAGRWAGDKVSLVGDYDSSKLYQTAKSQYTNISKGLVEEYNRLEGGEDHQLEYSPLSE